MLKTFTAMEQNPNHSTELATEEANTWIAELNERRATQSLVSYKWNAFTTTMTLAPSVEKGDPDWFIFTITATYGV